MTVCCVVVPSVTVAENVRWSCRLACEGRVSVVNSRNAVQTSIPSSLITLNLILLAINLS